MAVVNFATAMPLRRRVLMSSSLLRISEHAPAEYHMISYHAQKECDWIADTFAHCRHGAANEGGTERKSEYSSCGQNPQKVATEWIQMSHHLAGNLPVFLQNLSVIHLPPNLLNHFHISRLSIQFQANYWPQLRSSAQHSFLLLPGHQAH